MICYSTNLYTILIKDNGCGLIASIINHLNLIAITIVDRLCAFAVCGASKEAPMATKTDKIYFFIRLLF